MALESNPSDSALLNSIFRSVHSLKGGAGFFGFDPIVKLAHVMESVMSLLRDAVFVADQPMISLLISTADKLNLMLVNPERAAEIACAGEIAGLQAILDGNQQPGSEADREANKIKPSPTQGGEKASVLESSLDGFQFEPSDLLDGLKHGHNFYVVSAHLAKDIESQDQTLEHFLSELASLGTLIDTVLSLPENTTLATCPEADVFSKFFFITALEPFILSGALGISEENIQQVDSAKLGEWVKSAPVSNQPLQQEPQPETTAPEQPKSLVPAAATVATQPQRTVETQATPIEPKPVASPRRKADETIRISVGLLDSLMNLAGEMVLGRNRLLRLAGRSDSGTDSSEMQSVVQEISSVTSNLQDTIMRARLQPVGGLFGKFTRIVRDLSHKLNKEIQLEIFGDDVELDRTLLEGLSDPLTHLVRNSVDHGIELPSARIAKGKTSCGTIRLSAAHLAGRVQIEVLDDGGGMDPERLKAKAIEKGILTNEQAGRLSDSEALQLIFAAGLLHGCDSERHFRPGSRHGCRQDEHSKNSVAMSNSTAALARAPASLFACHSPWPSCPRSSSDAGEPLSRFHRSMWMKSSTPAKNTLSNPWEALACWNFVANSCRLSISPSCWVIRQKRTPSTKPSWLFYAWIM
jgi:two-component system chemotaxis sensor kinase CheA